MKPKHVFVGLFLFVAAMIVYAQYESFQREEERREILIEIQKKDAAEPPEPATAPAPVPANPVKVKELPSVTIAGTTLKTGMTWDDALPTLQKGERLSLERPDADSFVDVRSFDGQVYRFAFWRSDGPYRLLTIIER